MMHPSQVQITDELPDFEYSVACWAADAVSIARKMKYAHPEEINAARKEAMAAIEIIQAAFGATHQ
jgi:hypothetical protein